MGINFALGHANGKTGKIFSKVENLLKKESASPKTIDGLKIVTLQNNVVSDNKYSSALPLD